MNVSFCLSEQCSTQEWFVNNAMHDCMTAMQTAWTPRYVCTTAQKKRGLCFLPPLPYSCFPEAADGGCKAEAAAAAAASL